MMDARLDGLALLIVVIGAAAGPIGYAWLLHSAMTRVQARIEQGRAFCETLSLYNRAIKADLPTTGWDGQNIKSTEIASYEEFTQLVSDKTVKFGRLVNGNPLSANLFPYAYYAYPWNGTVTAEYVCCKE